VQFGIMAYVLFWSLGFGKTLGSYNKDELTQKGVSLMLSCQWMVAGCIAIGIPLLVEVVKVEDIMISFGMLSFVLSMFVQIVCDEPAGKRACVEREDGDFDI
jgi:hypothetical protein